MSHQKITCLTLLDLFAAFDTIDHFIPLERLSSWFRISSTALSWIKSYLLNRFFYVNIQNSKSSVFQLLYGVPQGSVLVLYSPSYTPLLSVHCQSYLIHQQTTTSTLIIYPTQLLLFSALDFSHNITHLENTLTITYQTGHVFQFPVS